MLHRLCGQQLISKQYDKLFGNSGVFYQLSKNTNSLTITAKKLKTTTELLKPPYIRHAELLHSQICAVWAEKLKQLSLNHLVLREYDFLGHDEYEKYFVTSDLTTHQEQRPDVFMLLKNTQTNTDVSVAIEIELHQKSEKRLLQKLKNFTSGSHINAVIYVCSKDTIQHRLQHIYKTKILERALRIKHYGNYFLMFTPIEQDFKNFDPILISADGHTLKLNQWLSIFSQNKKYELKNNLFETTAKAGWMF